MAEEEDDDNTEGQDGEQEGQAGGGKKKIILLGALILVVIALSVGGTLTAIKLLGPQPALEAEIAEEAEPPPPPKKPAIYFPIKPPIIVNFDVRGRQRFLQAELTFLIRDEDVISAIELHMPMIRNSLVLLIGGQLYEEIQTAEGKELLRQACLREIQALLKKEINKEGVEQVLFSNFVMQ